MKIEEIDAIVYKNGKAAEKKETVVKDETITLTINGEISRSLSAMDPADQRKNGPTRWFRCDPG